MSMFAGLNEWVNAHPQVTWWLVAGSVFMFVASAIAVPVLVARMRADYFMPHRDRAEAFAGRHPIIRWTGLILKNIAGTVLAIVGLAMFVTPGQGILTLFMGILLIDFPGKRKLELWLIRRRAIRRAIDWIRKKAGREPMQLPENGSPAR
jgi:hypothetical protein